jgi:hypothetical protein
MIEVADELVQAASTKITGKAKEDFAIAQAATPPTQTMTVQDRAAIALASDKTRQDLLAMATKYTAITEIKNKAGRDECHAAAMTLASARIAISKTGKAARDDATKFSKAVIQEEASLIAITEPEEKRLLALRDEWDAVVAAERAAREAAERARVLAITERIAGIRQYVELAASCRTAARVDELLTKLSQISLAGFEEFGDEAAAAHLDAMERVTAILATKNEQEAEQARIKAEQAEAAAKLAAEREAFAAQQAAAKAEADRVAAVQAAQAAQAQAAADAAAAALASQRAAFEAQQAMAAAETARQQEQLQRQRAEIEAQTAEVNRLAAQAEQDRVTEDAANAQTAIAALQQAESMPIEMIDQAACGTAEEPSDADVMWVSISAVAKAYNWTTEQATERLAAIKWTL